MQCLDSSPLRYSLDCFESWSHATCPFLVGKLSRGMGDSGIFLLTGWTLVETGRGCPPFCLLERSIFIAWYKYNQKASIKLRYYCSSKLERLEVSASWLLCATMNILWERKYLVSDSFYSAATHRTGNLPDFSSITIIAHPSLQSLFHRINDGRPCRSIRSMKLAAHPSGNLGCWSQWTACCS